jgi:hypothetical protein
MELSAQVKLKTSCGVGEKRFPGGFSAPPAAMVKKPAGLRMRPTWKQLDTQDHLAGGSRCGHHAWAQRSSAASGARGIHGRARLEAGPRRRTA